MEAQSVLTQGGKHAAAEPLVEVFALANLSQNADQAIGRLEPGADKLCVVHLAMLGFGGLFVRGNEPVGQIVVSSVGHTVDIVERKARFFGQIIFW